MTSAVLVPCASLGLAGCQSYERAPLDLPAHRAALGRRALDIEPLEAFAARLDAAGAEVPEALSFADGLTPAEGEVVALFYNPDLRISRLEADVALADLEHAGLWEDPVFGFDGAELLSPSGPFEYGLTLRLTIPISGRLAVAVDRAGAEHEAGLRAVVDREWVTRAAVRVAWARWTIAAERARVTRELIDELALVADLTGSLQRAGELSRADARVFSVALAGRRADLIGLESAEAEQRAELLFLLGLPPDAGVELVPGFAPLTLPELEADLERRLIEGSTALAVRRAEYRVAEETLRLEVQKQYPDIEIGGGYGSEDDDRLLLGVSVPVPVLNANRAGIAEARAQRELARAVAETTYERLSHELALALIRYREATGRRAELEQRSVEQATEQLAELQRLAELGEVDTLLLLESLGSLFDARMRTLELRLAEHESAVRLVALVGPAEAPPPAPVAADDDTTRRNGGGER
jgi:outer membrane protein TolC